MMTTPLILDSLEIKQFRSFRHLRIERLGRVNLIVGKNNVGKSCLLEALWLYANRGNLLLIRHLLQARNETDLLPIRGLSGLEGQSIKYLFWGRKSLEKSIEPIQIGPLVADLTLSISVTRYIEQEVDDRGQRRFKRLQPDKHEVTGNVVPGLLIQLDGQQLFSYPLFQDIRDISVHRISSAKSKEILCTFISANGFNLTQIGQLWDTIALTGFEEDVLAALRIIEPNIERVNLLGRAEQDGQRLPVVKLKGIDEPISLGSLGEGMNRLFGIALALVNAQGGLLLIDEVESGLHYSVQPDLWRLIFEMAHRLNVQVFATSHSWDCIKAFQQAAQEDKQEQGMLISLRRKKDKEDEIVAVLFDEQELATVTREQIEVR